MLDSKSAPPLLFQNLCAFWLKNNVTLAVKGLKTAGTEPGYQPYNTCVNGDQVWFLPPKITDMEAAGSQVIRIGWALRPASARVNGPKESGWSILLQPIYLDELVFSEIEWPLSVADESGGLTPLRLQAEKTFRISPAPAQTLI